MSRKKSEIMFCNQLSSVVSRREMLQVSAAGFGNLALAGLANEEAKADTAKSSAADPLSLKETHFPAKAKRVIFLFMHGGPSQVDTFDYKPLLERDHGKPLPFDKPLIFSSPTGNLLKSPWAFQQYGQSGAWVSDLFPHVAQCVDDLCIINGMHGSNSRHGGALLELHTGSDTFVRPSMGSWSTYGLGTENQDLPGFITMCPTLSHGGSERIQFRVSTRRVFGNAARKRQHSLRSSEDPVYRQRGKAASPTPATGTRPITPDE